MNEYELTVLIHPDLETDIETPGEAIKKIVEDAGGKITAEENLGKKRLMYTIKGEEFAVYLYRELELPNTAPQKISGLLNIMDGALRYLLVKADPKVKAARAKEDGEEAEGEE